MKRLRITYKWELIIMLWVAYFLNQGDRQIFNVVIPLIKEDLHLTDVQLGFVASVFTIVYGCLVPFGGYMGDFLKRKWIILISILIFSIGTLCTGFSGGLVSLIILRGITTGGGEAFYYPAATSLISQYHHKTRAMAMSIHQTSLYVGIVASGFIAAYIGEHFGWRMSFFTFGLGGLLLCIYLFFRMEDTPQEVKEEGRYSIWYVIKEIFKKKMSFFTFGLGGLLLCIYLFFRMEDTPQEVKEEGRYSIWYVIKEIFKKKTVWMLCLAFGGMCFVNIGYVTWMSTFYHEKYHLSLSTAGFTSMFFHFAAALLGVLIGGKLSDCWGF